MYTGVQYIIGMNLFCISFTKTRNLHELEESFQLKNTAVYSVHGKSCTEQYQRHCIFF